MLFMSNFSSIARAYTLPKKYNDIMHTYFKNDILYFYGQSKKTCIVLIIKMKA